MTKDSKEGSELNLLKNLNVPDISPVIDYGRLAPFVSEHNAEYVGLLVAHQIRRGNARNMAVNYYQGNDWSPSPLNGANNDLVHYYEFLKLRAEADKVSEDLIELIEFKKIEAETIKDRIENENLPIEEKRELLKEWEDKIDEVVNLAAILEDLSGA